MVCCLMLFVGKFTILFSTILFVLNLWVLLVCRYLVTFLYDVYWFVFVCCLSLVLYVSFFCMIFVVLSLYVVCRSVAIFLCCFFFVGLFLLVVCRFTVVCCLMVCCCMLFVAVCRLSVCCCILFVG